MKPNATQVEKEKDNWEYAMQHVSIKDDLMDKFTIKGSQFCSHYWSSPVPVLVVERHLMPS